MEAATVMRRIAAIAGVTCVVSVALARVSAQKPPADQWPNYQHNSNFSPLTQITPQNVSKLTKAWTFNYVSWLTGRFTCVEFCLSCRSS
jgi:glucose dehydrogenase